MDPSSNVLEFKAFKIDEMVFEKIKLINKNTFENLVPYLLLNLCLLFSQTDWERGNLKMIDELNFKLNLRGIDDDAWGKEIKELHRALDF